MIKKTEEYIGNNKDKNCTAIVYSHLQGSFTWRDVDCSKTAFYICKKGNTVVYLFKNSCELYLVNQCQGMPIVKLQNFLESAKSQSSAHQVYMSSGC